MDWKKVRSLLAPRFHTVPRVLPAFYACQNCQSVRSLSITRDIQIGNSKIDDSTIYARITTFAPHSFYD